MFNIKKNTIKMLYNYLFDASRTLNQLRKAKKNNLISMQFIERIMLSVTEVNGCDICSYGHTKIALEQGMSKEEIELLLSGDTNSVPANELHAVMFAQHYADTSGKPTQGAWNKLIEEYGIDLANGILGATRMIMFGNFYMIPIGNVKNFFSKNKTKKSSLFKDLISILSIVLLLPTAIIHALIDHFILKEPLIKFENITQIE